MQIGLFGGTFDPIHYGHVSLAKQLRDALGLDEVWFLVTPQNPWKQGSTLSDDALRLEMVRLALKEEEGLIASDYEFHLEKPSYSYQTLRHLREDFPDHDFTLLIGADNWVGFHKWSHPEEILENHRIGVFPREGYPIDKDILPPVGECQPRGISFINAELLPVSSTQIRKNLQQEIPIEGLVSESVAEFIYRNNLYLLEVKKLKELRS